MSHEDLDSDYDAEALDEVNRIRGLQSIRLSQDLESQGPSDSNVNLLTELSRFRPFLTVVRAWAIRSYLSPTEAERLGKLKDEHPRIFMAAIWGDFVFTALAATGVATAVLMLVIGAAWKLGFG